MVQKITKNITLCHYSVVQKRHLFVFLELLGPNYNHKSPAVKASEMTRHVDCHVLCLHLLFSA